VTERQRRSERLVRGIRAALDRGASPERIHAELVRRNMPPEKATLLLDRIMSAMAQPLQPAQATAPYEYEAAPQAVVEPMETAADTHRHRRRRTPFFLALAVMLLAGGLAGVVLNSREATAQRAAELAALAERLDGNVEASREHLEILEARIEARRTEAAQLEWLRARIARGPHSYPTPEAYTAAVARYERRRAAWNRTLPEYQVVTQAFRTLAGIHNARLDSLDALTPHVPAAEGDPDGSAAKRVRVAAAVRPM
jgi:hypothetical protein